MNNKEFLARLLAKEQPQPIRSRSNMPVAEAELYYTADDIDIVGTYTVKDAEGGIYQNLSQAIEAAEASTSDGIELVGVAIVPKTAELELEFVVHDGEFKVDDAERHLIGDEAADQLEKDVNSGREPIYIRFVLSGDFSAFVELISEPSYAVRFRRSVGQNGARIVALEIADAWRISETAVRANKPMARVIEYEPQLLHWRKLPTIKLQLLQFPNSSKTFKSPSAMLGLKLFRNNKHQMCQLAHLTVEC